ncbi:MAG: hypothetical protein ACLQUW_09245 [Desulfobaccales bacterium]
MDPKTEITLCDSSPLSRQEQFVLKQAAAGEIADLKQEFGDAEEGRRLRAVFLEDLLTGDLPGVRIHRRGVRISSAVIEEPLDLENAEVAVNVWLAACIFKDFFSVMDACFNYYLSLNDSHFLKAAVFHRLKLAGSIFCRNTVFAGPVAFSAADIKGQFGAKGAKFLAKDYAPNFNGLQVGKDAFFDGVEFHGPVDFGGADIKGQFVAQGARFLAGDRKANFNGLQVGQVASFDGAEFYGPADFVAADIKGRFEATRAKFSGSVDFGGAEIKGQFGAKGAKFLAADQKANFNGMQVGKSAFFDEAEFHGPVAFVAAFIKGQLTAKEAKFLGKGKEQEADFNSLKVGQNAFFDGAEFHGPVDFGGAEIKGQFTAGGAKFLASEYKVDFHRMVVGQDAFFWGCDFHGVVSFVLAKVAGDLYLDTMEKSGLRLAATFRSGVNFRGAEIGGEFSADKAQFLGHISDFEAVRVGHGFHANGAIFAGSVYFTGMAVKDNFYLDPFGRLKTFKTLFMGPADFSRLEVGGVFNADQAIFKSESTIFSGLKVGRGAFFIGTVFFGGLVLKEGQLTDLVIRGLHPLSVGGLPLNEIVLNRTRIAHRLTIRNIEVKRFEARSLEVKGPVELLRLAIKDEADWRDASLYHLQLVEPEWPAPQDRDLKLYLDGLSYKSLTTRREPHKAEKWQELLDWLGCSRFNAQNYSQLDAFFERAGLRKWADKAFITGKRRELAKFPWWHPGRWLTKILWDWPAGFGRKPARTLWPALVLVLLGWLAFHASGQPFENGLAVSLDRFLPGVDLGAARAFQPASPENYVWAYWHLEKIMGWVLAPIALAAIYTRIK